MASILILNDINDNLDILENNITEISTKFVVMRATSPKDALFQTITANPDIIVIDDESENIQTESFVQQVKSNMEIAQIPMVIILKDKDLQLIEQFNKMGVDAFLNKPYSKFELITIFKLILKSLNLAKQNADINDLLKIIQKQTTEHIKVEQQLETKMQFFNSLINTINSPIFFKNTKGEFISCNKEFSKYIGLYEHDIIGRKPREIVSKDLAIKFHQHDMDVMRKRIKVSVEAQILYSDGKMHEIIITKSPLFTTSKEPEGIIGVITDITKERLATEKLKEAEKLVEDAEKLKNSIISNITGDIIVPAENILNFVKKLNNPDKTLEEKGIFIDKISFYTNDIINYINNILIITNIESSKFKTRIEDFYVEEMLAEVFVKVIELRKRKDKLHIEIISENLAGENILLRSDRNLIMQTLLHLLDNSLKFTKQGHIKFGYEILKEKNLKFVKFFVEDTGIGIEQYSQDIIFKKFTKLPSTEFYPGAGLGLCLARNFVQLLYGRIWVTSYKDKGAKFFFTIPYRE